MNFIHKLKKGVAEAGTKVSATMEANRLRLQMSSKKKALEAEFRKIGEAYFANYVKTVKTDIDSVLEPYCENILAIQQEIEELANKLKEINNEKTCPCGKVVSRDVRFCPSCGHKFEE